MHDDRRPSLAELKRESERTRATLTDTVDNLHAKLNDTATAFKARISPANIKEEVTDHVRKSGKDWVNSLKRTARDNPLQTAAIGAGLAYPLWSMLRSIPAPIMLLGAGFVLAHQRWPGSVEEDLMTGVKERASDVSSEIHDAAVDGVESISKSAKNAKEAVSAGVHSLIDKATGAANEATKAASDLGQTMVENTTSATKSVVRSVSEGKDSAVEFGRKSGNAILDFAQRNPFLVAGTGLAIGAFVAASVPASESEKRLFGESSDDLKKQAQQSAAAGLSEAKKIAANIVSDVSTAAAREGLNAEGLTSAVEVLTAGVKSVADKGLQTALGGIKRASSQN